MVHILISPCELNVMYSCLYVICCLTLSRFGACADAVFRAVDLLSLHHDVLETFVVSVEAVLQQLTERHRAAGVKHKEEKNLRV